MATKKSVDKKPLPINMLLLSEEEIAALRAEARKSVIEEMTQAARDEFFQKALIEARREQIPEEQLVHVTIDMAPFSPGVMLDGVQYFHGYTYEVTQPVRAVLFEQMHRSWRHQDEIDGRRQADAYRRPRDLRLSPAHVNTANSILLGV